MCNIFILIIQIFLKIINYFDYLSILIIRNHKKEFEGKYEKHNIKTKFLRTNVFYAVYDEKKMLKIVQNGFDCSDNKKNMNYYLGKNKVKWFLYSG